MLSPLSNPLAVSVRAPVQQNIQDPDFPFLINACDLSAVDKMDITTALLYDSIIKDLMLGCLDCDKNIRIDFEFEAKLRTLIQLGGIDPREIPAEKQQAIKELIKNKIHYFSEVSFHLREDVEELERKFSFHKEDIVEIKLSFPEADDHNGGKSPVFVRIQLQDGSVRLVYKPRSVQLEAAICDPETGLFARLNKDPRAKDISFPTYEVLAFPDKEHGYCGYVIGKLVAKEEFLQAQEMGDIGENFLRVNPYQISDTRDFINFLKIAEKAYKSESVKKLIQNPKLLNNEKFCERKHVKDILDKIKQYHPPLNNPTIALKLLGDLPALYNINYFFSRTKEQLDADFLLCHSLQHINLSDTHASNFISKRGGELVPIDLESFDDPNLMDMRSVLPLIHLAYSLHGWEPPQEKQNTVSVMLDDHVPEFVKEKERSQIRYIPLPTNDFYDMLWHHLKGETDLTNETKNNLVLSLQSDGFEVFRPELERELDHCVQKCDIPYFKLSGNDLMLNNVRVAMKQSDKEK